MLTFFDGDADPGSGKLFDLESWFERIRIWDKPTESAKRLKTDQERFVDVSLDVYRIYPFLVKSYGSRRDIMCMVGSRSRRIFPDPNPNFLQNKIGSLLPVRSSLR
jgi:hypothetical protein